MKVLVELLWFTCTAKTSIGECDGIRGAAEEALVVRPATGEVDTGCEPLLLKVDCDHLRL